MKNKNYKVLLYHGVSGYDNFRGIENFSKKHISKKLFLKQMLFLKKNCNVVSINELEKYKKEKKIKRNTVIITFDDGFENNFKVAVPILIRLNLPCIFYISTGMIGKNNMFWVDKIEDIINRTKIKYLDIFLEKNIRFSLKTRIEKIKAVEKIKKYCKSISASKKDKLINNLSIISKIKPNNKYSKNYRVMNWKQVKNIANNDLFEIGGHSFNHDILTRLTVSKMKKNIKQSITPLEKKLKKKIKHYSYPEGQSSDYNYNVKKYLRSLGVKICPTAIDGIAKLDDDNFEIKRIMVGINGQKFPFNNF
jgi:peptidoglycan/xylan/chitin deacetylase (PgdA/CDA1 family)